LVASYVADIGSLDEKYFVHCEDLDWCMRARQHGWKILSVSDAKVKGISSIAWPLRVEWCDFLWQTGFFMAKYSMIRTRAG
jgi:hypothetical protein